MSKEVIKHPDHYCYSKFEPKDVIREWGLNFNLGSAVKYISRAGRKDDILVDLKKAQQFIQFEIEAIEAERKTVTAPHKQDKSDDIAMDALMYSMLMHGMNMAEMLSVKPIMVKVPDGVDVNEFIKGITGAVSVGNDPHPVDDKKKFEEFNEACLPVLEFLNKYYDPHSYAVITEGRAEIVRGEIGIPLPIRD
jgi:hypothetical protein